MFLEPFPHVAGHIEVSVGARAAGARTYIGGSGASVNSRSGSGGSFPHG